MNSARKLAAAAIGILVCALPARGEVSAETDLSGKYIRTMVSANASVKNLRIWTVGRTRPTYWPLNPAGDVTGDLWPYIAESPTQDRWPWVAWSRFNGRDYDLVWSRWTAQGWTPVADVEAASPSADALEASMAFDPEGRPLLVWLTRGDDGRGHVDLSLFLNSRWMSPFRVSDWNEDALNPSIVVRSDGTIEVSYDTPRGRVTRTIKFARPSTITDDITPFGTLTVSETKVGPLPSP